MKRILISLLGLTIILILVISVSREKVSVEREITWYLPKKEMTLLVVDTQALREQGLSGRPSLPKDQAMLFVFKEEGDHQIWMKEMQFPIDVIWLDREKKIIYTLENLSPATYPQTFAAPKNSLYIIETNVDVVRQNDLQIGDPMNFTN